jgi:AcrR family transcriptional regulator
MSERTPSPAAEASPAGERKTFRRATRSDAIELAKARFLAGDRVEMQVLADELSVSRTTLYRWVGEREQLYGEVFGELVDEWLALVEPQVEGAGIDRFATILQRFLEFAAGSEPLTLFTQREPTLAMRILMDPAGPVTAHANAALRRLLSEIDPEVEISDQIGNGIGVVSRTLVWANIATGQEPDIDGAVSLARTLLQASGLEAPERAR